LLGHVEYPDTRHGAIRSAGAAMGGGGPADRSPAPIVSFDGGRRVSFCGVLAGFSGAG
jgi:hypothetical protein